MTRLIWWFALAVLAAAPAAVSAQQDRVARPICLDGRFGDWRGAEVLVRDPIDADDDAVVDFGNVAATCDPLALYLYVDLGREVNIQAMDGRVEMFFDVDGSTATGLDAEPLAGADLRITCSLLRGATRRGSGIGAEWLGSEEMGASIGACTKRRSSGGFTGATGKRAESSSPPL